MHSLKLKLRQSALASLGLLAAYAPGSAIAQGGSPVLEEIIVTANKREQSLQKVAAAVTGFSADYINEAGIDDLLSITELTPGFSMSSFSLGQPQLYIRGIGSNEDGAGGDPSVASYIDGIYVARAAGYPRARSLSENIAKGPFTPDEVVHRWMNSSGHRRNILRRGATVMGMGVAFGENANGFEVVWVQVFASRR